MVNRLICCPHGACTAGTRGSCFSAVVCSYPDPSISWLSIWAHRTCVLAPFLIEFFPCRNPSIAENPYCVPRLQPKIEKDAWTARSSGFPSKSKGRGPMASSSPHLDSLRLTSANLTSARSANLTQTHEGRWSCLIVVVVTCCKGSQYSTPGRSTSDPPFRPRLPTQAQVVPPAKVALQSVP